MRLLVVAEEIEVDDRQSADHVQACPEGHQLAQQDADGHAREHHAQFLPQVPAGQESADAVAQGEPEFHQHHAGHADGAVEVEQEEDDEVEGVDCPP